MELRTYSQLIEIPTYFERYHYLALNGVVGDATFGFDRWLNQRFYTSTQWRHVRNHVIARDRGLDLACEGYEIHDRPIIHHMNPMRPMDIVHSDGDILDPEFLITTTHRTHNAIHYGDESQLPQEYVPRSAGDTKLW